MEHPEEYRKWKEQHAQAQNNGGMGVYPPRNWPEMSSEELKNVLGITIKEDDANKLITFLSGLLTYTSEDQLNLMFNAPSSSGKSFISTEIVSLFPQVDVIKVGYASPTAFWYQNSVYDEERDLKIVDLGRKIILFQDMPHFDLLKNLRALLSHDDKEIEIRVTNRSKKGENRADHIVIKGYPTVLFASASFRLDEQEMTRFIMLSPETNQTKTLAAVEESAIKVSDPKKYLKLLNSNSQRSDLIYRIADVKNSNIEEVVIPDHNQLLKMFRERYSSARVRHARDIKHVAALAKGFTLLNLWTRKQTNGMIMAEEIDLQNAFALWDEIFLPQELGIPPFVFNLYREVIYPAYKEKGVGLERMDIQRKYVQVYHNQLPDWKLRKEYQPMLLASGVLYEEQDLLDKRKTLVYPVLDPEKNVHPHPHSPISPKLKSKEVGLCVVCGGNKQWRRSDGEVICARCHPPVNGEEVFVAKVV